MASNPSLAIRPLGPAPSHHRQLPLILIILITRRVDVAIAAITKPNFRGPILISLVADDIRPQHHKDNVTHKVELTRVHADHNTATNKTTHLPNPPTTSVDLRNVQEVKPIEAEGYRLEVSRSCRNNAVHGECQKQLQPLQNSVH